MCGGGGGLGLLLLFLFSTLSTFSYFFIKKCSAFFKNVVVCIVTQISKKQIPVRKFVTSLLDSDFSLTTSLEWDMYFTSSFSFRLLSF